MSGSTSNGVVIGSGSDSITLKISQDSALGENAKFTVNVDGRQIGGLQEASASHSSGQDDTFTFQGNYGTGSHNVVVTFANNFIYPGLSGDRNLYVDGVTYNGQTVSNSTTPIYESPMFPPNSTVGNVWGNATFKVNDTTPAGPGGNATTTPGAISVGSGSDTLVLNMSEDAYQGDAQFTVAVDGKQVGGTLTTTAIVGQGQQQEFDVHGNFGGGNHTVTVDFLNDQINGFYPGTTWAVDTTDRNLYVMSANLNGGQSASGAPWELSSAGSRDFSVSSGSNQNAGSSSATTSDTAAITSSSLASGSTTNGSTSGMTFVAPETAPVTAAASNSTASVAATVAAAAPTATDYTAPVVTSTSGSTTPDTTVSSGNQWMTHQSANGGGWMAHHHG